MLRESYYDFFSLSTKFARYVAYVILVHMQQWGILILTSFSFVGFPSFYCVVAKMKAYEWLL